ncbi:hypothetical protein K466DRAFT_571340, partial [Polyporus arcularius HHB13444]
MLRATALLLRHHALRAHLRLRSLLHLHQPLRTQPDAPPRTSILHPLESTSLLARRVSKARSMTRLRITSQSPASTPEPDEREHTPPRNSPSPDPLEVAPVDPEPAHVPAHRAPVSPPASAASDDELDLLADGHEDAFECTLEVMMAGIEHVYSDDELVDYLSYDDALAVAFESVVEHASKASQEHFGEPRSISEVMRLEPEERERWLKAAQDEIQSLVENGTFQL